MVNDAWLKGRFQQDIEHFKERCETQSAWLDEQLKNIEFAAQLSKVWACSRYSFEQCLAKPDMFQQLVAANSFYQAYQHDEMAQLLAKQLEGVDSKEQLDKQLRDFRQQQMLRIIWRDLNRLADMVETTRDVSALADASIQQALAFHHRKLSDSHGLPSAKIAGEWRAQELLVLGMGKLGGGELNLSSDIDLIFCYPANGETRSDNPKLAKKCLDNHSYFTRLGQRLIQSLDTVTADGFVFRVDMRLRPYGDSGPLVQSFAALEEYYQDQGREWERYAMIKARAITGSAEQKQALMELLRPFSYRRYIDFSAIDALRSMKKMIQQELKRRKLGQNVKLGSGGIREIEFIAQSFQLIRGGREAELQNPSILAVLHYLAGQGYLPEQAVAELLAAYRFLRNTEHAIQAYQDRQTQILPSDENSQQCLALAMGYENWQDFLAELSEHRNKVARHFDEVISESAESEQLDSMCEEWQALWLEDNAAESVLTFAREQGYEDTDQLQRCLAEFKSGYGLMTMQAIGRERLDQFMPLLLLAASQSEQPLLALDRCLPLVEGVLRRTAYLMLLIENPAALDELVRLCAASPWISNQLARYPVLLDELLDAGTLYHTPEKTALRDELQQQVLRIPMDDLEAHMETLRYFKLAHVLKVAACEVSGRLPLMKASDYLSWIADVILEHVLALAWHSLAERHGNPQQQPGTPCDRRFIIIGYGKLGGIELGYGSDLDLVFLHDVPTNQMTDGPRAIDNATFFTRLGQRMIHILTAHTPSGTLYEIDMRLRPSGNSGMLTSSLAAFKRYQEQDAWVWEHQALVRARVVAGDASLAESFNELRQQLLTQPRELEPLREAVVEMRKKMRDHLLPKGKNELFALKQGVGGIVDIEFMVQYAVLAWSQQWPALAAFTDNIRILESLQKLGLLEANAVAQLIAAYQHYRAYAHRRSLQEQAVEVPYADVDEHRAAVIALWQQWLEADAGLHLV